MTKKTIRKISIWSLVLLLVAIAAPKNVFAEKQPTYSYTEETANADAHIVEVLISVSLLTGPGYENDRINYNGEVVKLEPGDKVAGMSSVVTSYQEMWIEVRFVENDVEFHGYVYSGYVEYDGSLTNVHTRLTNEPAVNIPTPTPLPTDTPIPTATPTAAPSPTEAPTPVQKESNFPIIPFIIIIAVMVVLAAAAYYYLILLKRKKNNNQSEDQIKKLKHAADRESVVEREKLLYENVSGGTKASPKDGLGQGVYTVKSRDEELLTDPNDFEGDERLQQIAQNVKEKEIIRRELEALDSRDMVYHKYFGEGQVMDNSDVNNVEVKFTNHGVMYIDKEEAARKALMRKL